MPQWDFLDLLADVCSHFPGFSLLRSTRIDGLISEGGRVVGVTGTTSEGDTSIRARLVVDASGRDSVIRAEAGLTPVGVAAAMDVLWFRLSKRPNEVYPFIQAGAGMIITIDRDDFLQIAHVIPAGSWHGTADDVARMKLGDAAHAMSPAGGVGINLAIQDAVACARILGPVLRQGTPRPADLRRVQRRRAWPARITQTVQRRLQGPLLSTHAPGAQLPLPLRMLRDHRALARLTGRFVGMGVRPEHIR